MHARLENLGILQGQATLTAVGVQSCSQLHSAVSKWNTLLGIPGSEQGMW